MCPQLGEACFGEWELESFLVTNAGRNRERIGKRTYNAIYDAIYKAAT